MDTEARIKLLSIALAIETEHVELMGNTEKLSMLKRVMNTYYVLVDKIGG